MSDIAPNAKPAPEFERRSSDVNFAALSLRLQGLEGRVEVLEEQGRSVKRAIDDLKPLAQEVHDAVFGDQTPGLAKKMDDVHGALFGSDGHCGAMDDLKFVRNVLENARKVGGAIEGAATGAGKFSDGVSKGIKRFWWLIALAGFLATYLKTGKWPDQIPLWPQ